MKQVFETWGEANDFANILDNADGVRNLFDRVKLDYVDFDKPGEHVVVEWNAPEVTEQAHQ